MLRITCPDYVHDPRCLPVTLAGKECNDDFLKALPDGIDPCGEKGEFHSFAFDGPMFNRPVEFAIGETVEGDGFIPKEPRKCYATSDSAWSGEGKRRPSPAESISLCSATFVYSARRPSPREWIYHELICTHVGLQEA